MIKKLLNELIKFPVRLYQWVISPLKPSTCRHEPTCSNYMLQAVDEWGPLKGFWLGLKRVSKCHPWGTHGYDPVPKRKQQTGTKKNNRST